MKKVKQYSRYCKCRKCGKLFKLKRPPIHDIYCPVCSSKNIDFMNKREFETAKILKVKKK